MERGIEPHIPVFEKSARTDGSLSRADFHLRPPPGRRLRLFERSAYDFACGDQSERMAGFGERLGH